MPEGQYGEETFNELEENANAVKSKVDPLIDKGIEKGANAIAGKMSDLKNARKDGYNKVLNDVENVRQNSADPNHPLMKMLGSKDSPISQHLAKKDAKKAVGAGKKAGEGLQNAANAANKADKAGNAAASAAAGAAVSAASGAVSGFNPGDMIKNAGGPSNGEASGDVAQAAQKMIGDAIAVAVDAAKLVASGGTDIGAWIDVIKRLLPLLLFLLSLPLVLIFMLTFCMGMMIMEGLGKFSETFTAISEQINPTKYEEFSMEAQYKILSEAFGDEVYRAYELMLEDVNKEIEDYHEQVTYNEWQRILDWNKAQKQIDYSLIHSYDDQVEDLEQGMPNADVYIGGYVGHISDSQWGNGGRGNYVDYKSKTNPNFNKGLLKENAVLSAPRYANGNEVYFDDEEVKETIQATLGYAAVSDMAYLVSGYNVSMMEAPIINFGTKVSTLKAGTTIIKYKIDISERIFLNTVDSVAGKYGDGFWGTVFGVFSATEEMLHNKIAQIFDGETTFFTYDASLIEVVENPMTRTVIEYQEKIYENIQEEEYQFHISYTDSEGNAGSTIITKYHSHEEYLKDYTHNSVPHYSSNDFIGDVEAECGAKYSSYSIDSIKTVPVGNTYPLNRSIYAPVTKNYTKHTLDIPMSAFDVDRILKALFETSPYYGEMDYYYTDHDATYGETNDGTGHASKITSDDEILNKYGKYIDKWKYAYYDESYSYTGYDGNTWSHDYVKGELFENGIDKQPYMQQDEVYLYTCNCDPAYGVHKTCPNCGKIGIQRSNEIKDVGGGDRPLTYIGTALVQLDIYFGCILNGDENLEDSLKELRQNTLVAMTTVDKKVIDDYTGGQVGGTVNQGTSFVNDNKQTVNIGDIDSTVVVNINGNNNTEKTWNFLMDKGFTKEQAAGIMGNIEQESGFRTTALNTACGGTGAYGMIQWTEGRQKGLYQYCSANGFSPTSVEGQLNYMWHELTEVSYYRTRVYEKIIAATTVAEVTTIWGANYEVYAIKGTSEFNKENNERIKSALEYYKNNGGEITPSTTGTIEKSQETSNRFGTSIEVILTDSDGYDYYPITVMDRILSNKDSILNVLENSDEIQQKLAKRGLTYDQRYTSDGSSSLDRINISPLCDYISNLIKDITDYTTVTTLENGEYSIGIGSWRGGEASKLLQNIIANNPDLYKQACLDAGLSEIVFNSNYLYNLNPNADKYEQVIRKLLEAGQAEQDAMFDEKVLKIVTYLKSQHITDSATLSLLASAAMYFEDIELLDKSGGDIGQFREYVMNAGINAGNENSFETTFSALMSWVGNTGNEFANTSLRIRFQKYHKQIVEDKENDIIPWIGTGELAPEELEPLIDMAMSLLSYKSKIHYEYGGDPGPAEFSRLLKQISTTGEGEVTGDCSSFVEALYYSFGYNVPGTSGAWRKNGYGYKERTDFENIQVGDVIVYYYGSKSHHVELYVGEGMSIGLGSEAAPKYRKWDSVFKLNTYNTASFFRVVE